MATRFSLRDTSPESIIKTALIAAQREHSVGEGTTAAHVASALDIGEQQSAYCLLMAEQLDLVKAADTTAYRYTGDVNLRRAPSSGLPTYFRKAVQGYPPFLIYASYLVRGYESAEAARFTKAAFELGLSAARVGVLLSRWAKYAGIVGDDGKLDFEPADVLEIGFLRRLAESLQGELATQTFVIEELGHQVWARLQNDGIDVQALSRSLLKHHVEPEDALREVGALLESYLAPISSAQGGPTTLLVPMADFLAGSGRSGILKAHRGLTYGIASLRNVADHGPDPDTGRPWNVSSEAGLLGSLMTLILIRSISRYIESGDQRI